MNNYHKEMKRQLCPNCNKDFYAENEMATCFLCYTQAHGNCSLKYWLTKGIKITEVSAL